MMKLFKNILAIALLCLGINESWTDEIEDSNNNSSQNRNKTLVIVNTRERDDLLDLLSEAQSSRHKLSKKLVYCLDAFQGNAVFTSGPFGEKVIAFYDYVENNDLETKKHQPYKMEISQDRQE